MAQEIALPKNNAIYNTTQPRLTQQILQQLRQVDASPTKDTLAKVYVNLEQILAPALIRVSYDAYIQAARQVDAVVDATHSLRLAREARLRAKQSSRWVTDTTGKAYGIIKAMGAKMAISEGRADLIAVNELSLQFFGGTRYGWGLDPTARKTWELSDGHDVDDTCDDNADDGPILIVDAFTSGDFIPPAHINCDCYLGLVRVKTTKRSYFF